MASSLLLLLLTVTAVHSSKSDDAAALLPILTTLGFSPPPSNPCLLSPSIACNSEGSATHISLPSLSLAGSLSPSISRLSSLRHLSLPGNRLTGPIPHQLSLCTHLQVLVLRSNAFSGPVPHDLRPLSSSLRILDLSFNSLHGDLGFLTQFPNLEVLSLAGNYFSGRVPPSISSFRNLRSLDFSGNPSLVGPIPDLYSISLRSNSHRRSLRRGVLHETSNSTTISTSKSPRRSNAAAAAAPSPSPTASPSDAHHRLDKRKKIRSWLIGFFVGVLVGVVSGVVSSFLFRLMVDCVRGRYRNPRAPAIFSPLIRQAGDLAFLEKDDGLASLELIGRGGCGEVYRAELPYNPGKVIAIKKIVRLRNSDNAAELEEEESKFLDKQMRQLRSEIQTVGHIRHRNLLPLLAHVSRPDCNYLVYEYMKNGSLLDALKKSADGTEEFTWAARLKIAQGVADGLDYLHMQHSPRIIHRDLKPANILIDDNLEARIADFGLAKAVPDADTHVTTSNVAGTIGYIAPEYHQMLKFTDKCDIYSFGVILAVLVVGKMPSDDYFQSTEEMSLVKWLRNVMGAGNEAAAAAIDGRMKGGSEEEVEEMVLVLKIACFCTADDPKERPNSKDVRTMLNQIKRHGHHQQ